MAYPHALLTGLPALGVVRIGMAAFQFSDLAALNRGFESGESDPPPSVWDEWLWRCDLAEPVSVDCLLNRMHLLGLLIARYRARREPGLANLCVSLPHIVHQHANVSKLTPRQLKDLLEDLQMHWTMYLDGGEDAGGQRREAEDVETLAELVDALMVRFGCFCLHPFAYDDVNLCDPTAADRMSVLTIRRIVSILCVLYRHLHMLIVAQRPEDEEERAPIAVPELQDYHVQASQEAFYRHSMHADIPPAARLLYQQDFSGFYHCVSQVVYFHYPSYERRVQISLERIRSGTEAVHTLAPVMELFPEIHLCYEDENWKQDAWNWVLMGRRVYLVGPAPRQAVWYARSMLTLLALYLRESGADEGRRIGGA